MNSGMETADNVSGDHVMRSHRDPLGHVLVSKDRVLRVVDNSWRPLFDRLQSDPVAQALVNDGKLIESQLLSDTDLASDKQVHAEDAKFVLKHPRVDFPSFPYEWPWEMLQAAGELTLDLSAAFLEKDLKLKDATPFNVLFRGPNPVFIDILSFEEGALSDQVWRPEGQFTQTFLLPLLLARRFGLPSHSVFMSQREGLTPEEVYPLLGPLARLNPLCLWLVTLPTLLAGKAKDPTLYRARPETNPEKALFLQKAVNRRLRKQLRRAQPGTGKSVWSEYEQTHSYSDRAFDAKKDFVTRSIKQTAPRKVLDIGCNEGAFTIIAAESGASVVAIDYDPVVVGRVWRKARDRGLDILPLVQNLSTPSPALGWRLGEFPSFLDRARGHFDLVHMLAVIHHLLVTDRVPIDEIFDLVAEITTDHLIIEYVGPTDPMFKSIARGRDSLFNWYDREAFETAAQRRFTIVDSVSLPDADRAMYLLKRTPTQR